MSGPSQYTDLEICWGPAAQLGLTPDTPLADWDHIVNGHCPRFAPVAAAYRRRTEVVLAHCGWGQHVARLGGGTDGFLNLIINY